LTTFRPTGGLAYDPEMADSPPSRSVSAALDSALSRPIGRRRALAVIGSSVAGVVFLDACGSETTPGPRGWVTADVDPTTLTVDQPVPVRFTGQVAGSSVGGSAWLVLRAGGELVAFDPKCTHASCAYEWTDQARFACLCHEGFFDVDGNVVSGPPKRPLDEYRVRQIDGRIELYVPADYSTPRPKT
jgi:nitrite reductase/ring-hydroxylating ferredoxin subunit